MILTRDNNVYRSADSGKTWESEYDKLAALIPKEEPGIPRVVTLINHPRDKLRVCALS